MVDDRRFLIGDAEEGKLEEWEVSIAKGMLKRGYPQQYVHSFFSYPERTVASRRFSGMDREVRYQNIPTATDDQVQEFIEEYQSGLGLITRKRQSSEERMIERFCQDASELSQYLKDDEELLLIVLRSLRVFVNTIGAEWSEDEFDERFDALFSLLAETVRPLSV